MAKTKLFIVKVNNQFIILKDYEYELYLIYGL